MQEGVFVMETHQQVSSQLGPKPVREEPVGMTDGWNETQRSCGPCGTWQDVKVMSVVD